MYFMGIVNGEITLTTAGSSCPVEVMSTSTIPEGWGPSFAVMCKQAISVNDMEVFTGRDGKRHAIIPSVGYQLYRDPEPEPEPVAVPTVELEDIPVVESDVIPTVEPEPELEPEVTPELEPIPLAEEIPVAVFKEPLIPQRDMSPRVLPIKGEIPESCQGVYVYAITRSVPPAKEITDIMCIEDNWQQEGCYFMVESKEDGKIYIHSDGYRLNMCVEKGDI